MLVAMSLDDMLLELGCEVAGMVSSVGEAMTAIADYDVAILDLALIDGSIETVADRHEALGIPFILAIGASEEDLVEQFRDKPILEKPYSLEDLKEALIRAVGEKRKA